MNEAEKIILCILAGTLVVFLILGIFALIKIIRFFNSLEDLTNSVKGVANSASNAIDTVTNIALAGNVVSAIKTISELVGTWRNLRKSRPGKSHDSENLDD